MSLYNLKTIHALSPKVSTYRMTKFDDELNVEKVYELSFNRGRWNCDCMASNKPTCRHREMAPLFIKSNKVNSGKFYNYEKEKWI